MKGRGQGKKCRKWPHPDGPKDGGGSTKKPGLPCKDGGGTIDGKEFDPGT